MKKPVLLLGFISFLNDVASEMLYPVLPIFLTQIIGAPVYILGVIEGFANGGAALFKTVFGYWSDKLQKRKPFIFYGYLSSAVSKVVIALSNSWSLIFVGRFLDRFGKGLRTGPRDALLLGYTDKTNKVMVFGFHRAMDSAGAVLGPIIALILLQKFTDIRTILFIAAVPSFIAVLFIPFIAEARKSASIPTISTKVSFNNLVISKNFKKLLIGLALFSLGSSSDTFLILQARNLGLSLTLVIVAYVLYNIVYTISSIPAGRLSDKLGSKKVFIFGILIYFLVYSAFALNKNPALIWLLFAIYGLYIGITDGVSSAWVGTMIKVEQSGTAYGIVQTVTSLFTLSASVLGGIIWTAVSPSATFGFGAFCALLSIFLFLRVEDQASVGTIR